MKVLLPLFLLITGSIIAQNSYPATNVILNEDAAAQKLKNYFSKNTYYTFSYNKFNHSAKINDNIVNLSDAIIEYKYERSIPFISFRCKRDTDKHPVRAKNEAEWEWEMDVWVYENNLGSCDMYCKECIHDISGENGGCFSLGFISEEQCYTIINLLADLKNSIK